MRRYLRYVFLVAVASGVVACDQASKRAVLSGLAVREERVAPPPCNPRGPVEPRTIYHPTAPATIVPGLFDLRFTENCGGAWSLLEGAPEAMRYPFLVGMTLVALAFIVFLYRRLGPRQRMLGVALPLVLGGAAGNFMDRLHHRFVVDFFHAHVGAYHWPIFNVADSAIAMGVVLILIDSLRRPRALAVSQV